MGKNDQRKINKRTNTNDKEEKKAEQKRLKNGRKSPQNNVKKAIQKRR